MLSTTVVLALATLAPGSEQLGAAAATLISMQDMTPDMMPRMQLAVVSSKAVLSRPRYSQNERHDRRSITEDAPWMAAAGRSAWWSRDLRASAPRRSRLAEALSSGAL